MREQDDLSPFQGTLNAFRGLVMLNSILLLRKISYAFKSKHKMRIFLCSFFLVLSALSTIAAASMTKQEVVKLYVDLKVSESDIIAQINKYGAVFHLTIKDILDLKKAGLSDSLIKFMMSTSQPSNSQTVKETTSIPKSLDAHVAGSQASDNAEYYENFEFSGDGTGYLGGKATYELKCVNGVLSGSFFYQKNWSPISVKGRCENRNEVIFDAQINNEAVESFSVSFSPHSSTQGCMHSRNVGGGNPSNSKDIVRVADAKACGKLVIQKIQKVTNVKSKSQILSEELNHLWNQFKQEEEEQKAFSNRIESRSCNRSVAGDVHYMQCLINMSKVKVNRARFSWTRTWDKDPRGGGPERWGRTRGPSEARAGVMVRG